MAQLLVQQYVKGVAAVSVLADVPQSNISYLSNVTSDVQSQLDSKLPLFGGNITNQLTVGGNVGIGTLNPLHKLHVIGDIVSTGSIQSASFSGLGSSLSNLNASLISSGTIDNSRLSSNIAVTSFAGSGSSLSNLNASYVTSGTLANARMPSALNILSSSTSLTIDSSGNIGIGDTTPPSKLSIVTSTNGKGIQFNNVLSNRKIIMYETANNDHQYHGFGVGAAIFRYQIESTGSSHVFYAATSASSSTELMRIAGSGSVGIGTNAPSNQLHVYGNVNSQVALNIHNANSGQFAFPILRITNNNNQCYIFLNSSTRGDDGGANTATFRNENGDLRLQSGPSVGNTQNGLHIKTDGNVGIGINAPSSLLHVNGTITSTEFKGSGASLSNLNASYITSGSLDKARLPPALNVATNAQTVTITSSGNVGIGETVPSVKLHVNGDILSMGTVTASNLIVLGDTVLLNTTTSNTEQLFVVNAGSGPALKVVQSGATPIAEFYDTDVSGASPVVTIANSGYVGIGTSIPTTALHIEGVTTSTSFSGSGANLTSLDASAISSGTLNNARLPSAIAVSTLAGDGASLSNLNASLITSGTLDTARLPSSFSGNGASLSNLNASYITSGTLNNAYLPSTISVSNLAGDGASLSNLNATLITSGTLANARLPSAFSVNTTNTSIYVNANGNVGIQTSSAIRNFHVEGDINFTGSLYQNNVLFSSGSSQWTTASTNIYYTTGNVGVGTSSPLSRLHVDGNTAMIGNVGIGTTVALARTHVYFNSTTGDAFRVDDEIAPDLTPFIIRHDGNIGIGTHTPSHKLHVQGNIMFTGDLYQNATLFTSSQWTTNGTNISYTSGNVGIGANPTARLHVASSGDTGFHDGRIGSFIIKSFTRTLATSVGAYSDICTIGTLSNGFILYADVVHSESSSSESKSYIIPVSWTYTGYVVCNPIASTGDFEGNDWQLQITCNGNDCTLRLVRVSGATSTANYTIVLKISESSARLVTITPLTTTGTGATNSGIFINTPLTQVKGNVGIGVTNPFAKLHVEGDCDLIGNIGIGTTTALARTHVYYNSTNGDAFRVDDEAAPDLTPFIIRHDGNVGVGTTNPTTKLHVQGDTFVSGNISGVVFSGSGASLSNLNATYITTGTLNASRLPSALSIATNTQTVTIDATANVGIGTTTPMKKLDIVGDINYTGNLYQNGLSVSLSQWTNGTGSIYYNGNVGIGVTNPLTSLDVGSNARIGNVWFSDVNERAKALYSDQISSLTNWIGRTPAANKPWKSIAWAPEIQLFVAITDDTTNEYQIMTSPDSINWTVRTTAPANWGWHQWQWQSVCWSPTVRKFVAVANNGHPGQAITSSNGITWTSATTQNDQGYRYITWVEELSLYIAIASAGGIYSSDATSWSGFNFDTNINGYSVCWSKELRLLVAVGNDGTNRVATSTNATSWTTRSTPSTPGYASGFVSVCWSPELSLFVAVSTNRYVITSPNGINWTLVTLDTTFNKPWTTVTWSRELSCFLAVHSGSTSDIMTSFNGTSWTLRTISSGTYGQLSSIVWASEMSSFVGVSTYQNTSNLVATSKPYIPASKSAVIANPSYMNVDYITGNVGIGTTFSQYKLHIEGSAYASEITTGAVYTMSLHETSDSQLKGHVHDITQPLEKVQALRGVNFTWKESGRHDMGLVAQEVESVIPEVVVQQPNGTKTVAYGHLVGLLIEAIKEQQKQIDELRTMIVN